MTLTINQPQFNLTATKTLPVSVTAAALKIKSLGCPGYITEYTPFTCNPVITTDSVTGTDAIKYQWQINGNLVSTDKKLYINSPDASAATVDIVLTAAITEGTAGNEIAKNVGSQTIKINPNKTKLSLTVTAPKMAETGTEITLSAGTKFQTPSMVDYQWTINNKLYSGSVVKYAVNAGEPEGITYSVTAQPSCCSSIPAETKTGKITVASYAFPVITLTGPAQSIANIAPYKASFKLAVVNKINEAMTYAWDFGDGTGGTATTPIAVSHLYSQPGTYNVVLTATDTRGGSNQYTTDVTVGTLPERNVEIKGIMSNKYSRAPVSGYFKYNISGGLNTDSPVSSLWSINGQTIGNKAYVTQLFPQAGTYNLQLDVATRFGNNISAVLPVTVKENQAPMCTITKKLVMAKQYQLYANCVDTDGKIVAYKWDLGNGSTSQTVNASVRYTASGVYTISLTATDDSGAVVTVEDALSVD